MDLYHSYVREGLKDPVRNLVWRHEALRLASKDRGLQRDLREAAYSDLLFFVNCFCWLYEPRGTVKKRPFITWSHQDPAFEVMERTLREAEEQEKPLSLVVKKSRAQGATWMYLCLVLWHWLREPLFSAGLVTRNESLVDSLRNSDTLLWKVAWELERLPTWLLPEGFDLKRHRSLADHTFANPETGATICGYSATGDVARGGRKTLFVCDEIGADDFIAGGKDYAVLASISYVTHCVFLVSTFGADAGAFYEAANDPGNRVVTLSWRDNESQSKLAYVVREGMAVALREEEQEEVTRYYRAHLNELRRLERRGYALEKGVRSPFYDAYCLLPGATPRSIAREMDMDPRGAVGKVFSGDVLDRMRQEQVSPPLWQGKVVVDEESMTVSGVVRQEQGPLKLWFRPGVDGSAPQGRYSVGCDIAAGTAGEFSSNSSLVAFDVETGEQVAEFASSSVVETRFARLAVAICRWLHGAYLAWEANGVTGVKFGREVLEEIGYYNVYYRETEEVGSRRRTRKAGVFVRNDAQKGELLERLCIAMEEGQCTPRSEDLIRECGEYEWDPSGGIVHRPSKVRGVKGKAHGDRVVAAAIAWIGCMDLQRDREDKFCEGKGQWPPYGSLAWLHEREQLQGRQWTDDEPLPTLADVLRDW